MYQSFINSYYLFNDPLRFLEVLELPSNNTLFSSWRLFPSILFFSYEEDIFSKKINQEWLTNFQAKSTLRKINKHQKCYLESRVYVRVERIFVVTVKPGKLEINNCSLYDNAFVLIRFTELSHQTTNLLVVGCRPKASQAVGAAIFSSMVSFPEHCSALHWNRRVLQ